LQITSSLFRTEYPKPVPNHAPNDEPCMISVRRVIFLPRKSYLDRYSSVGSCCCCRVSLVQVVHAGFLLPLPTGTWHLVTVRIGTFWISAFSTLLDFFFLLPAIVAFVPFSALAFLRVYRIVVASPRRRVFFNMSTQPLKAAILVVSTTAAKDPSADASDATLRSVFGNVGGNSWEVVATKTVPDDVPRIQKQIMNWTDGAEPVDFIATTGGTGFAVADYTPEAVSALLHRSAPGLVHAMLSASLAVTPCRTPSPRVFAPEP